MRNFLFLMLLCSTAANSWAQGIQFFEGSWEEALKAAAQQRKLIFVDAYTTWCGPCKQMAKDVFTQEEVSNFYNKNFINVKLDMEKGEGIGFGQKYKVTSYPTFLYIDEKGEVVNTAKGSRPADQFIALGKATLNRVDKSTDYEEQYEEGERSAEFLRAYAYSLLMTGKPSLKIANEYLRTQTDLNAQENLDFIYDFTTEADSRLFDLLMQNKAKFIADQGEEPFKKKVQAACDATVRKAIEYQSDDLLKEAQTKYEQADPAYGKEYGLLMEITYYFGRQDNSKVLEISDKYIKKYAKNNAAKYYDRAAFLLNYVDDAAALAKAEEWAKKAFELKKEYPIGDVYAKLLERNGKSKEAAAVRRELEGLQTPPNKQLKLD